jgi:hypothetical protein
MARDKTIFLRNDDVRDTLDDELIRLTEICINLNIPISHAVEPANVSKEVVDWLLEVKSEHPKLIEIIQHGFDHNLKNPHVKMEFGGNRSFEDQFQTMKIGKQLMNDYFNKLWSPVFTFPYGSFNQHTLEAVDKLGYVAISSKVDFSAKSNLKNRIGRMMNSDFLIGKKISYHPGRRSSYRLQELSVSANLIRKYIDSNTAIHYSPEEVLSQINNAARHTNVIGVLFHHRFHTKEFEKIELLLCSIKEIYSFSTIMSLVR